MSETLQNIHHGEGSLIDSINKTVKHKRPLLEGTKLSELTDAANRRLQDRQLVWMQNETGQTILIKPWFEVGSDKSAGIKGARLKVIETADDSVVSTEDVISPHFTFREHGGNIFLHIAREEENERVGAHSLRYPGSAFGAVDPADMRPDIDVQTDKYGKKSLLVHNTAGGSSSRTGYNGIGLYKARLVPRNTLLFKK